MTSPTQVDSGDEADRSLWNITSHDQHHGLAPSESQDNANRLMDDLELLQAERVASNQEKQEATRHRSRSANRRHHPEAQPDDAFDTLTREPQMPQVKPAKKPTLVGKLFKEIKRFPRVIRYFVYAIPPAALLLTPILLDIYALPGDNPVGGQGGLQLLWFGIWLEIVWCSLWASRILAATMPGIFGGVAKIIGSSNHHKWGDIGRQMELPTAAFLWMLGQIASFRTIADNHRSPAPGDGGPVYITWIDVVWKVIIALFVLATSNFAEKILIQWIATTFHVRTYAARIEQNRLNTDNLINLYEYSKLKLLHEDADLVDANGGLSGTKTPLRLVQQNAKLALNNIGKAAGRMAGDLTGRKVMARGHPRKVVLELLRNTHGSHILARRIYRTLVRNGADTITPDDLKEAFKSPEDADACFGMFDQDMNGDISMEELELVCNEVHLEKKAIAASLKDLDSVIKKLDQVFLFIIFIIAAIVFVSIISGSAASALGTSGTTILGLSWMLQATAQEFLQSIIFVFVKHPFDVGDRVTVYGNTGSLGTGDDYYVQEISLLYTEFKKMEGHIVQAPNSLLNTLFILNQRRSSGLADPIELKLRFGTSAALVEELKARMVDFVVEHKRDYQPQIISEVRTIDEVYSVTLNVIFFHKSNYQNELVRLQRHNKFATELMAQMKDLGIEGPRRAQPGGDKDYPFYYVPVQPPQAQPGAAAAAADNDTDPDNHLASEPFRTGRSTVVGSPVLGPRSESLVRDNASFRDGMSQASADWHDARSGHGPSTHQFNSAPYRRRRADSRARMYDHMPDFGDVFEGRKDPATANLARLQVLREEAAAARASSVDVAGSSARPLGRTATMDSTATSTGTRKRGLFGRPRSSTRDGRPSDAGASIV
ncbi:Mechanosensitive ion channel-domain-containing protein [Coniella lustricola]|uniref:Mechanosensitive ion channel-domain-containing protein n=1 Tax=Coniella lustricola TaxID=2025994 RepID=A0A2T2ZZH3_9PEZI|nr:Mechanosensitive ion channel-domain-containing protein [Coniella lustricola]